MRRQASSRLQIDRSVHVVVEVEVGRGGRNLAGIGAAAGRYWDWQVLGGRYWDWQVLGGRYWVALVWVLKWQVLGGKYWVAGIGGRYWNIPSPVTVNGGRGAKSRSETSDTPAEFLYHTHNH